MRQRRSTPQKSTHRYGMAQKEVAQRYGMAQEEENYLGYAPEGFHGDGILEVFASYT